MNNVKSYAFNGNSLRVLGTATAPIFILADVCKALGLKQPSRVLSRIDPLDVTKVSIETSGGRQTLTAINESGLYTVVLRSDDAMKEGTSSYRFRRWVTSEVLPAIRRTGSYTLPRKTISVEQQQAIRSAIANRAARSRRHYQTIYRALYERFQIPRYTELLASQFDEALNFINAADLNVPIATPSMKTSDDALVLDRNDAERIMNFVYYWRYLFKPELEMILRLLRLVDSPKAARFYEVVTELHLPLLEGTLERHGYSVKGMPCYKHLMNNH